jgi:hypothetical protein
MLILPDPISGLPIPQYFENVLWLRTGRTRIPLPSLSNNRRSPARTPRMRRTSRGTVICPLLVILACFRIAISCFLTSAHSPYFRSRAYAAIEFSWSRELSGVCVGTVAVQPGCTNLGLGTLLCSRTNANDESRIGHRLAPAKTEYKWRLEIVARTLILGEHTANVKSPVPSDF